jgi:large subunit ribosomal protein L4
VVSAIVDGETPSTKTARTVLESVSEARHLLVVLSRDEENNWRSVRNLPNVHVIAPDQLNTYDVLVNDDVVFTRAALDAFLAGPVKGRAKATARSGEVEAEPVPKKTTTKAESKPKAEAKPKAEPEAKKAEEGPYGTGSHAALEDGSEPEGFPVKGNESSKLYHLPGTSFYNRTEAEVWFAGAEAAEEAGFQLPPSQRKSEEDK